MSSQHGVTPEPPAGSEHYREGWRTGYEQAGIDTDLRWTEHAAREAIAQTYDNLVSVDWPARFRAAERVAEAAEFPGTARDLDSLAEQFRSLAISWPHVIEAIGRALLGEGEDQ